jgi:hypothetical protein
VLVGVNGHLDGAEQFRSQLKLVEELNRSPYLPARADPWLYFRWSGG